MKSKVKHWIHALDLEKHPEGGYFKEVYRSSESLSDQQLPERFTGQRSIATSIYFLLPEYEYSAFHRIQSDETWYFHEGSPLEIYVLKTNGDLHIQKLGLNVEAGEIPQFTVPYGHWFAAKSLGNYSLVGCAVAPGFDFSDFEMASADVLCEQFPQYKDLIKQFSID